VTSDLGRTRFAALLLAIVLGGLALRTVFPTADPPWHTPVGIVWHDEGPWVHNARNRVLFGHWTLDQWNPMYLAPVFTGLEYASFASFGVGTWQARLVSEATGTISIVFIALGVAAIAGRRAGLAAAAILATNFIYVMWDRAALMEATMTAFMVMAWAAYALAPRRPVWGGAAGVFALLAFFTKAAAAFFVAALGLDALIVLAIAWSTARTDSDHDARRNLAIWTLGGLAVGGAVALAIFVIPCWTEFRFYNWQMSVTRKPSYTVKAILDRASWVPIIHDFFTRQWLITVLAAGAGFGLLMRWWRAAPAERLLGWWIGLGFVELVLHDVGNERRFVFFIPALAALAALALVRDGRLLPSSVVSIPRRTGLLALPLILFAFYVVLGAIARLAHLYEVGPGVHLAALAAVLATAVLFLWWDRVLAWLSRGPWSAAAALAIVLLVVAGDLVQFAQWAALRTYKNVTASRLVGQWLPAGTLVHGKLANGLSLENRIRPVFVGHLFGNYDDRTARPDIRYVLTYTRPRLGYEGPVILDVLAAHPGWKIVHEFDVAETPAGDDRAALIEKP
jgi:4-amino-4-deoxy-L-arabinose transferase-like glycosyltransferase